MLIYVLLAIIIAVAGFYVARHKFGWRSKHYRVIECKDGTEVFYIVQRRFIWWYNFNRNDKHLYYGKFDTINAALNFAIRIASESKVRMASKGKILYKINIINEN